jgi:hypothetical protein
VAVNATTGQAGAGSDVVETRVAVDPVTLRWEWRGYDTDGSLGGVRELCDSEAEARTKARAWLRMVIGERIAMWSRALSEVGQ